MGEALRARDALITSHLKLVRTIANRVGRLLPSSLCAEDRISAGHEGLIDAASRFDPSRGLKFVTFAAPRIAGAMRDSMRRNDNLSRDMRRLSSQLKKAGSELSQQLGRYPSDVELAGHLGVTVDELMRQRGKLSGQHVIGYDDVVSKGKLDLLDVTADPDATDALDLALRREAREGLEAAIARLSPNMQKVLSLYYSEDLTLKEIGKVMNLTESRICQIHTEAAKALRAALDPDTELD